MRVCGGIFTKSQISARSDEDRIQIKEDDVRNPGVIADCVGDNAGDLSRPNSGRF
ncbi:MAG: sodium/proton-translocating pyrophosphatase [Bdellovibrionales bacterium]|nr:sodium/proton-translocating pyrophosphatase [Bdellovibrionales bacterium]